MKRTWILLGALAAVHLLVLFAGFFAPYDPADQDRTLPFAPPSRVRFVDEHGGLHLRPFVYGWVPAPGDPDTYVEDRSARVSIRFFVRGAEYTIVPGVKSQIHLFGVDAPARLSLFGTDRYGRDVASRLLHGGRLSLAAGLLATLCSLLAGGLLGTLAGFYGGLIDQALMRGADLFMALPWLFLLFAVRALLPLHIDTRDAFLLLVGVIGVIGWARPARLIRAVVLSAKERTYVLAARGFGAPASYVIRRHVLPHTYGVVLAQAALLIPQFVLAEVTLSFVGLGVGEPTASWGSLLATLQQYEVLTTYWWMFSPALALVSVTLGYHFLTTVVHEKVRSVAI
jgi:peptide/nickel transport system permease protein